VKRVPNLAQNLVIPATAGAPATPTMLSFRPEQQRQQPPRGCHSDRSRSDSDGGAEEPAFSYHELRPSHDDVKLTPYFQSRGPTVRRPGETNAVER
jgi:hypothetical protein